MRVDLYQDTAGGWRWRLRARNGKIVAESGEAYSSKRKVMDACDRMADWAGFKSETGENDICNAFCAWLSDNGR